MVVSSREWLGPGRARTAADGLASFRRLVLPMSLPPPVMILLASGAWAPWCFPTRALATGTTIAAVLFFVAETLQRADHGELDPPGLDGQGRQQPIA